MPVVSIARQALLTCSHNAPTKQSSWTETGMLQRFASRLQPLIYFALLIFLALGFALSVLSTRSKVAGSQDH